MPLTPEQVSTLRAAVDRIVPADDFPSASELGVVDFLRTLIVSEGLEGVYADGLEELEAEARIRFERAFAALEPAQQDAILSDVETGQTRATWTVAPQEFFELLARQTVEGYYSDPANGGNRDGAAWRMVGFRVTA